MFYEDLVKGEYEDILPKEGTPVTIPLTQEQSNEEVIDDGVNNVEETTSEETTTETDENLQSKVDTSEEVSTSSLDEENLEDESETSNIEDGEETNDDEWTAGDIAFLIFIGIILLILFAPIFFMIFDY